MHTSIQRLLLFGATALIVGCSSSMGTTPATSSHPMSAGGVSSSGWKIGYYTASPHGTLSNSSAPSSTSGIASLNFTIPDNTALLYTDQKSQNSSLLGDLTGKTLSAAFTVSGVTGTFTYFGEPSCGGTTANVRYYFQTSNAGGFNEANYWWSNPVSDVLTNGSQTLAQVPLTGANWSDFYGHFGSDPAYSTAFAAAVSNVTKIGLSFGGGCFFENGVGTTDGSGTFTLNTFTAS